MLIRRTKWEISWNIWGLQNWSEQLTEHHPFPLERVEKWRSKLRKPTITLRFQQGVVYYLDLIWLVVYLPLWKMMEFVSWDDEIPNIWENKIHVPNHQPVMVIYGQGLIQGFIQSFQTASPTSQARKFIACNFVSCSSWPSRCRMSCQAISFKTGKSRIPSTFCKKKSTNLTHLPVVSTLFFPYEYMFMNWL